MGVKVLSSSATALAFAGFILVASLASRGEAASPAPAGDPFDQLKGDWKGAGTVILDDGEKKKVDCTVAYAQSRRQVRQDQRHVERERL